MLEKGKRHRLLSGDRHLGDLEFDGIVYPSNHITAIFTPSEGFEEVREIVEEGGISTELITGDDHVALRSAMERSARAWQQMNGLDLRIVDSNGAQEPIVGFVLDGNQAVFRYGSFRNIKREGQDRFWDALEEEVGPEKCREPECDHLRISLSIYCKAHHFRMIEGEDYKGPFRDG